MPVGGGQEINRGEGGISEWLRPLSDRFNDWQIHVSPHLADSEFAAGEAISCLENRPTFHAEVRR